MLAWGGGGGEERVKLADFLMIKWDAGMYLGVGSNTTPVPEHQLWLWTVGQRTSVRASLKFCDIRRILVWQTLMASLTLEDARYELGLQPGMWGTRTWRGCHTRPAPTTPWPTPDLQSASLPVWAITHDSQPKLQTSLGLAPPPQPVLLKASTFQRACDNGQSIWGACLL